MGAIYIDLLLIIDIIYLDDTAYVSCLEFLVLSSADDRHSFIQSILHILSVLSIRGEILS